MTYLVALGINANNGDGLSNCAGFPSLPAGSTGSSICTRAQNIYASLAGLVNNISQTYNAVPGQGYVKGLSDQFFIRERAYNFYGQDSWRVLPNLTLIAGLRYEVVPAPDMVNQRMLVPSKGFGDTTPYGPLFQTGSATYNDLLANLSNSTQLVPAGAIKSTGTWALGTRAGDFVYVSDVVAALLAAMRLRPEGSPVFNVCTGRQSSVLDLARQTKRRRLAPPRERAAMSRA